MSRWLFMALLACLLYPAEVSANIVPLGNGITVNCFRFFDFADPEDCGPPDLRDPVTFTIPEGGGPNEPFIEFGLFLVFNAPFTRTGRFDVIEQTDASGDPCPMMNYKLSCITDQISALNAGAAGNGSIVIRSDPPPTIDGGRFVAGADAVGCKEGAAGGCTFTVNFGPVVMTFFSDGDFLLPSQASDIVMLRVSEPSTVLLLGAAIVGLAAVSRKSRRSPAIRYAG